jgi:CHAD domain-containing protein
MGYRLERGEGMADGVRRIVAEQLEGAQEQLSGGGDEDFDAAVHDARKRLKKARSALRLVRDDMGQKARRPENKLMREAGRRLSGVRDAQVLLETLELVADRDDPAAPPLEAVRPFKERLAARRAEIAADVRDGDAAAAVAAQLDGVLAGSAEWSLRDESFDAAEKGLRRIHRRGRRTMAAALESGRDDDWHEWRKRAKDLWYALRILKPVAPGQLGGPTNEADALSDVLGDHNDVAVLEAALDEHAGELEPTHVELLRGAIDRRRQKLRLAALPLGRRLYGERSRSFASRLSTYWDAREAQAAAEAQWLVPEVAGQVRELLAAKRRANPSESRRIAVRLRRLGFRIGDFGDMIPRRSGGFSIDDFDELVGRGAIRVGTRPELPRHPRAAADGGGDCDGDPSAANLLAAPAALTLRAGGWLRSKLPV